MYSTYILPEEQPGGCREHSQTHSVKRIQLDDQNLQEQSTRLCVVGLDGGEMCNGRDSELELRTLPGPSQAKSTMQCPPTADTAAANLGSANTVHRK